MMIVRLFAKAKEVAAAERLTIRLAAGATVADLRTALGERCPPLRPLVSGLLIAVNSQYASDAMVLPSDAEIACFPPVSGG